MFNHVLSYTNNTKSILSTDLTYNNKNNIIQAPFSNII